jgi:aminopeptidase N
VKQTQQENKIFKLPIAIDIYSGKNKIRENVWLENRNDTFEFVQDNLPDLVNVDADKILLCEKKDYKTKENFIFQLQHAPNYLDRREALEYFDKQDLPELALGLNDKYPGLRRWTIEHLMKSKKESSADIIAATEKDKKTKAAALDFLAKSDDKKYAALFRKNVDDSSYTVAAAALKGLNGIDPSQSYTYAKKYSTDAKGALSEVVMNILLESGNEDDADFICNAYNESAPNQEKITLTGKLCSYLEKVKDESKIKKGIDYVIKFRNMIPGQYRMYTDPLMKGALNKLGNAKGSSITDYINNELK